MNIAGGNREKLEIEERIFLFISILFSFLLFIGDGKFEQPAKGEGIHGGRREERGKNGGVLVGFIQRFGV